MSASNYSTRKTRAIFGGDGKEGESTAKAGEKSDGKVSTGASIFAMIMGVLIFFVVLILPIIAAFYANIVVADVTALVAANPAVAFKTLAADATATYNACLILAVVAALGLLGYLIRYFM